MQSKVSTVGEYLNGLPADRRSAIESVRQVILKNIDSPFEEGMLYGMIGYYLPHSVYPAGYYCDPSQPVPFVCLASQKNYMSIYLGSVCGHMDNERWFRDAWVRTGKKLDMGKSCLRFKKLDDLALDLIGESIRRMPVDVFIKHYEAFMRDYRKKDRSRSGSGGGKSTKRKKSQASARSRKAKAKAR